MYQKFMRLTKSISKWLAETKKINKLSLAKKPLHLIDGNDF
jgi:hypothetical protein